MAINGQVRKIVAEDLNLGTSTVNIQKADGTTVTANQININTIPSGNKIPVLTLEQFNDALSTLGSNEGTIEICAPLTLETDTTIPENVTLEFKQGCPITVPVTITLTVNGGIIAGLYKIFDGDGTVAGSPKTEAVYPEWFGAKGDGVSDDTEAIQKAIDLADNFNGVVKLERRIYVVSGFYFNKDINKIKIKGELDWAPPTFNEASTDDYKVTVLKLKDNSNVDMFKIDPDYGEKGLIQLENLLLDGNKANQTSASSGINIINSYDPNGIYSTELRNVVVRNFNGDGIAVNGPEINLVNVYSAYNNGDGISLGKVINLTSDVTIYKAGCASNSGNGLAIYAGSNLRAYDIDCWGNDGKGLYIYKHDYPRFTKLMCNLNGEEGVYIGGSSYGVTGLVITEFIITGNNQNGIVNTDLKLDGLVSNLRFIGGSFGLYNSANPTYAIENGATLGVAPHYAHTNVAVFENCSFYHDNIADNYSYLHFTNCYNKEGDIFDSRVGSLNLIINPKFTSKDGSGNPFYWKLYNSANFTITDITDGIRIDATVSSDTNGIAQRIDLGNYVGQLVTIALRYKTNSTANGGNGVKVTYAPVYPNQYLTSDEQEHVFYYSFYVDSSKFITGTTEIELQILGLNAGEYLEIKDVALYVGGHIINYPIDNKNQTSKDIEITNSLAGFILIDRTTGSKYRLFVNNGTLSIEGV